MGDYNCNEQNKFAGFHNIPFGYHKNLAIIALREEREYFRSQGSIFVLLHLSFRLSHQSVSTEKNFELILYENDLIDTCAMILSALSNLCYRWSRECVCIIIRHSPPAAWHIFAVPARPFLGISFPSKI